MRRVRVLVVDDSVVVRRLVADILAGDPGIEVVGVAANGKIALDKIAVLKPDLVTLDLDMPVLDGLQTLRELRRVPAFPPVIIFSPLTPRGAADALEALELGASDFVSKPSDTRSVAESREVVRANLVPKILALVNRTHRPVAATSTPLRPLAAPPAVRPGVQAPARSRVDVVAIGSSTGGPDALTALLSSLPADLPAAVLVTQHMPAVFTRQFARRLDSRCALRVSEAVAGDLIEPGRVLIAPGDWHMRVGGPIGRRVVALDQGAPEHYCRPAVDVMFRSVASTYGGHALGLVLTGMGSDGALGAQAMKAAGGAVLAQDEATSVVWGMPGSVVAAGAAQQVLPLGRLASTVVTRVSAVTRTAPPLAGAHS